MSVRKEDQSYIDKLRDTEERLRKLESSQNNAVRKNDVRLSDVIVTAHTTPLELCLEDLNTKQSVCLGAQTLQDPAQAEWSFSGDITASNEGDSSPAYSVERTTTARQIVVTQPCGSSFTGTLKLCIQFCDNAGDTVLQVSLVGSSPFSSREINIPLVENDRIMCTIFDAPATAANNISVFVRFGTPTVGVTVGSECVA